MNPLQLIQILTCGNPQQAVLQMLQNQANTNPILNNLLEMTQTGNVQNIEQVARNIVSSQGLDFDTEFNKFKRQYNLN